MSKFEIGDKVIFNEEVVPGIYRWLKFTRNKEYVVLHYHNDVFNKLYTLRNDVGDLQRINDIYLSLSLISYRNKTINEILDYE